MEDKPKYSYLIEGADKLSLGLSIVFAILIGAGIGYWLKSVFEANWLFWLGLFWGFGAAGLNIYRLYKETKKELDEIKDDPKYYQYKADEEEDD